MWEQKRRNWRQPASCDFARRPDDRPISAEGLCCSARVAIMAGHDIVTLLSVGDITGTITANHSINTVTSFAGISADISAGGSVRTITAWHDIAGSITATATGDVLAGGAVTAEIAASSSYGGLGGQVQLRTGYPAGPDD